MAIIYSVLMTNANYGEKYPVKCKKYLPILNKAFLDDLVFSGFQDFPANGKINKHNKMKNCHYRQNFFLLQ